MRSPRSTTIIPNEVAFQGEMYGQNGFSMPPKQVLRIQTYQPKRNEFSIDSFNFVKSPASSNRFELQDGWIMPLVEHSDESFTGAGLIYLPSKFTIKKQDSVLRTDYRDSEADILNLADKCLVEANRNL